MRQSIFALFISPSLLNAVYDLDTKKNLSDKHYQLDSDWLVRN